MKLKQIIATHPVPWRYSAIGGQIQMIDGIGQKVELFTMLDFAVETTAKMVAPAPAPVTAHYNESVTTDSSKEP